MRFAAAPEYQVFPTADRPLKPYEAAVRAAAETRPLVAETRPDAVVADILTLAPALAGELEGVPTATLVPHVYPPGEAGFPPYSLGARLPRTPLGPARSGARSSGRWTAGCERGREELNGARARLGLSAGRPRARRHQRAAVPGRDVPAARVPAARGRPHVHVPGPLLWEPPFEDVELPPGDAPLVLVAPSTSQDPEHRLLRAALRGLAGRAGARAARPGTAARRPGRSTCRRTRGSSSGCPTRARCRRCDLVVCHGGHGTMVRALAAGLPRWSSARRRRHGRERGAGRLGGRRRARCRGASCRPRRCGWRCERALADERMGERVRELAAWAAEHDGAERAAEIVEEFAGVAAQAR